MPLDCDTSLPVDGFRLTQQFIFDLPGLNPFESPRLDRLLSETEVGCWLIVGGPLEWTLRMAVLGLLQRRAKVAVVSDCIGQWDPYEGDMALRQIESKNIQWLTAAQVVERYSPRPRPVCAPADGAKTKHPAAALALANPSIAARSCAPAARSASAEPRPPGATRGPSADDADAWCQFTPDEPGSPRQAGISS